MRFHLLNTFDKLYICDLHWSWLKKEKTLEWWKDENVFDIQVWTSIIFWIKTGKKKKWELAKLYHVDMYWKREEKYERLWNWTIESLWYKETVPNKPNYFFINKNLDSEWKYNKWININNIFITKSTGCVTANDLLNISFTDEETKDKRKDMLSLNENEWRIKYNRKKDSRDWQYQYAKHDMEKFMWNSINITYRPFDIRYTVYTWNSRWLYSSPCSFTMKNYINHSNIGLITAKSNKSWRIDHFFVTKYISEAKTGESTTQCQNFPLYLYQTDLSGKEIKIPNLDTKIIDKIAHDLWLQFIQDWAWDKINTFGPEDIFDYIYATLHSPTYREKYKEFLKIDFPRIPFTTDKFIFSQLIKYWQELRKLHLLESDKLNQQLVSYPMSGDNKVEKVRFLSSFGKGGVEWNETEDFWKVRINDTQYFDNVPEIAWNFYIGWYQPAQKRLKDRKDKILSFEDIIHYQKMIISLSETDKIMKEIGKIKFI